MSIMTANDIFADRAALDADLILHEGLLWARVALSERLVSASASREADLLDGLRIESMYQFCEFFYLLKARRIENVETVRTLADIHNQHLVELSRDKAKLARLGIRMERLLDAIFTGDTMQRLIEAWRDRPGQIDQSNLARFLVLVMSTETCRKLVVTSCEAGFLNRSRSAFGSMLVTTTGVMEQIFGGVMRDLRLRIERGAESSPA